MSSKKRSFSQIIKTYWPYYLLLLIPLCHLLLFKYQPMYGVQIAFKDYSSRDGIWGSEWVGFENFQRFFDRNNGMDYVWNTIRLSVYSLIAGFPFPIILALSLNYLKSLKFKKTVQMISYAPHFISMVVLVGIILQFFSRTGLVNNVLGLFGIQPFDFMGEIDLFNDLYVWSGIWQNVGFSSIIYVGVLTSVDYTLHEAAIVDGATIMKRMWYIDFPVLIPTAVTLFIMNTGNILNVGFEKVLLMQNPLNTPVSEIISTYVYKQSFETSLPDFSYSSAVGLFQSVVGIILLLTVNKIASKVSDNGIF